MFGMFHAHTFHLPILLTCTADNKTIVLNFWREKLEVCAQFPLCVIPLPRYCPQHTLIVPSAFVCVCMPCRELGRSTTKLLQAGRLIKPKDTEKNYKRLPLCKWHITLGSWLRDAVCCSNTLIKTVEVSRGIEKSLSWWNSGFWGWSSSLPGISGTGCDAQPLPAEFCFPRLSPSTLFPLVALLVQGNTT